MAELVQTADDDVIANVGYTQLASLYAQCVDAWQLQCMQRQFVYRRSDRLANEDGVVTSLMQ